MAATGWENPTAQRGADVHYARCHVQKLQYEDAFVTLSTVQWRGLEFWGEGMADNIPAALDAGLQIVCSMHSIDSFIPFRTRSFRLECSEDPPSPVFARSTPFTTRGRVTEVGLNKIRADILVEVPGHGYRGTFLDIEFAKISSLTNEGDEDDTPGGGKKKKAVGSPLLELTDQQRVERLKKMMMSVAYEVRSGPTDSPAIDTTKSFADNGLSQLMFLETIAQVNESLKLNIPLKHWGSIEETIDHHVDTMAKLLVMKTNIAPSTDIFANVNLNSLENMINWHFREKSFVEWVRNPRGPPHKGMWRWLLLQVWWAIRAGPLARFRLMYRTNFFDFLRSHHDSTTTATTKNVKKVTKNVDLTASDAHFIVTRTL